MQKMDTINPYAHLETPTLSINHCSDVSCSHPSCWASRKLYRRNAYLLMLKGEPVNDVHRSEKLQERPIATHREIPTQKVHNLVDELFRSASDSDDWQSVARGISAGQLSIKHMPTPMSSLSRNASKLHHSEEFGADTDEEADEAVKKTQKPVGQVYMQDMFQPSGPHSVYHSREYVWVPNPNRKPRPAQRPSEPDAVGRVNINEELGQFLHEDTYNQRQAALQERAVERSHLSTARVQRFFKTCAPASSTKHIDLFKLPSDLLSEVLRNVDEGEPMTNESLARMVEQAETPAGGVSGVGNAAAVPGQRDFQQHVLHQRRAQLHNSHSGRNLREPQKHSTLSTAMVFLADDGSGGANSKKRQAPLTPAGRQQQQPRLPPIGRAAGAATVTGQFKRSLASHCQLMLGPVTGGSASSTGSRRPASGAAAAAADAVAADDAASMAVECRSDRSTLLDEVLPRRQPGTQESAGFAALLALNRPSYDLDDPWADAAEGPHPTTRNQSMLLTTASQSSLSEPQQQQQPLPEPPQHLATLSADATDVGGASGSLTTPALDAVEAGDVNEDAADKDVDGGKVGDDGDDDEDDGVSRGSLLGAALPSGRASPGPPPPSPDVDSVAATGRVSSPPPARRSGAAAAPLSSKAKSAASSGQMPTLNEDEDEAE